MLHSLRQASSIKNRLSALQEAGHIKNTVVLTHLMYSNVAWELVSPRTQVRLQIIIDPDYLPDYLFVSYDMEISKSFKSTLMQI